MRIINIGLIGHGVVGQGVRKILEENKTQITKKLLNKTGKELEVNISKILVKNKSKHSHLLDKYQFVDNLDEMLQDDDIDMVVELTAGEEPASLYIKEILKYKNLVSANKLAIAKNFDEFAKIAKLYNREFRYEASTLAGLPIIKTIEDFKASDEVDSIRAIANGTTNFILSKMADENLGYEEALQISQEKGFAEADPTSDVEGFDSMYKLYILSKLAFENEEESIKSQISLENIKRQGISHITKAQIEEAKLKNAKLKLIARAEIIESKYIASVGIEEILSTDSFYNVDNETNAIEVNASNCGELFIKGKGAGARPTASGVVRDIIDIILANNGR